MRSSRGYLDALVSSVRPARVDVGARAVRQPDWGPTRLTEPSEESEPAETPLPRPATRVPARPSGTARPSVAAVAAETAEAPPEIAAQRTEPRHPAPPWPASVSRAENRTPIKAPGPHPPVSATTLAAGPAEAAPRQPAAPLAPLSATGTRLREIAPTPRLPTGTRAALERLEHLTRRFSSALPVEAARPESVSQVPAAEPVSDGHTGPPIEPHLVTLADVRTPAARPSEPPSVEIGSIEVIVAQPPSPAPVAAPVAPVRQMVAAPAVQERLSRPLHPYGFGQG